MCVKSKIEELRGHKVVPVNSHKFDQLLLSKVYSASSIESCLLLQEKNQDVSLKSYRLQCHAYLQDFLLAKTYNY